MKKMSPVNHTKNEENEFNVALCPQGPYRLLGTGSPGVLKGKKGDNEGKHRQLKPAVARNLARRLVLFCSEVFL